MCESEWGHREGGSGYSIEPERELLVSSLYGAPEASGKWGSMVLVGIKMMNASARLTLDKDKTVIATEMQSIQPERTYKNPPKPG